MWPVLLLLLWTIAKSRCSTNHYSQSSLGQTPVTRIITLITWHQWHKKTRISLGISPGNPQLGPPSHVRFPYHSHSSRDSCGSEIRDVIDVNTWVFVQRIHKDSSRAKTAWTDNQMSVASLAWEIHEEVIGHGLKNTNMFLYTWEDYVAHSDVQDW